MSYDVGFLIENVAGWVTNYSNLRSVAESDGDRAMVAHWHELNYYRKGGRFERLREEHFAFVPGYITGNLRFADEFRRALAVHKYDAILTNSRIGGILYAHRLAKIPTIMEFDATPRQFDRMVAYESPHDTAPVSYAKWRLHCRMYRSARLLHAMSRWAGRSAIDEYGVDADKVIVNPPGVDLSFWHPGNLPESSSDRRKNVLFVGGDFKRKGLPLLLEWYANLDRQDVDLHVVGGGHVEPRPGLFVYPNIPPNSLELRRLYQNADIFVLPTLADCFPLVIIEAMACGLPVIVSDIGGITEMVEDRENGFLVKPGDLGAVTAAITAVLDDSGRRAALGARSRHLAEERFDVRKNALRTLDLLKELATSGTLADRSVSPRSDASDPGNASPLS